MFQLLVCLVRCRNIATLERSLDTRLCLPQVIHCDLAAVLDVRSAAVAVVQRAAAFQWSHSCAATTAAAAAAGTAAAAAATTAAVAALGRGCNCGPALP